MAKALAGKKDAGGRGKSIQRRVAKSIAGGIRMSVRALRARNEQLGDDHRGLAARVREIAARVREIAARLALAPCQRPSYPSPTPTPGGAARRPRAAQGRPAAAAAHSASAARRRGAAPARPALLQRPECARG